MNPDLEMFCRRLLGALFNGAYQGLALTALIWLGLIMVPRVNAATRHMVWLVTLLLVAVLPVVHFLQPERGESADLRRGYLDGTDLILADRAVGELETHFTETSRQGLAPDAPERLDSANSRTANELDVDSRQPKVSDFSVETEMPRPEYRLPEELRQLIGEPLAQLFEEAPSEGGGEVTGERSSLAEPIILVNRDSSPSVLPSSIWPEVRRNWYFALPNRIGVILVGCWIVLASFRLGILAWQCGRLHSLKRRGTSAPDDLRARFASLGEEMGLNRKTHLVLCHESTAPMAVGFRRPAVLLPAKMFADAAELPLEQVLRHELAHVGRRDDWTNLLQQIVKALLFFHPAIWWLSRRLTLEREIACDDHVLAALRAPKAYALFLTEFAGRRQCRDIAAAPAAWGNKNQLKERITMILDSKRNTSPRLARARVGVLSVAAALVAILGLHAGPRLVLAGDKVAADAKEEAVSREIQGTAEVSTEVAAPAVATTESVAVTVLELPAPSSDPVESGPRPKPLPSPAPAAAPAALPVPPRAVVRVQAPASVHPTVRIAPPAGPMIAVVSPADHPGQPPSAVPASPRRSRPGDDSVERRLERLEQLVESLVAREKGAKTSANVNRDSNVNRDFKYELKGPAAEHSFDKENLKFELKGSGWEHAFDKEKFSKMAEDFDKLADKLGKAKPSEEALARIKDQAKRDAERAVRDAERAAKDLERVARESQDRAKSEERRAQASASRSVERQVERIPLEKQRQSLEAQRRALEKQMEAIERQIERLEEEKEKPEPKRVDPETRVKQLDKKIESLKPGDSRDEDSSKIKR
jgi:beta-lactamase regulating signal transducer with metallopeptidase domain